MITKRIVLLIAIIIVSNSKVFSQHWRTSGNGLIPAADAPTATSFVGTTIGVPFNLKTTLAQPMNFFTANTQRMVISGTTGFVGIGVNNYFATNSPLTMLHIEGVNATPGTTAWRNWMKTGVFMKENSDNMYVGVKTIAPDISYAIINWGDNNGGVGAVDLLSFNFTGVGAGGLESSEWHGNNESNSKSRERYIGCW